MKRYLCPQEEDFESEEEYKEALAAWHKENDDDMPDDYEYSYYDDPRADYIYDPVNQYSREK